MKTKIEAVPVKVPRTTYDRIRTYSQVTGIPIARILDKAMNEWMDVTGDLHIETLTGTKLKLSKLH